MPGYNPFDDIYANSERLRVLSANQASGRSLAGGDYAGAVAALARSGDVQGAQAITANRQNEQLRAAQMENYQSEAMARKLTAQQSFLADAAPRLKSAYDQAEQAQPGSGRNVVAQAYGNYLAPGLKQRGVADDELQRYGQLAQDPNTFFSTLGALAQEKVDWSVVGGELIGHTATGKIVHRTKAGRIVTLKDPTNPDGSGGAETTGWLDPEAAQGDQFQGGGPAPAAAPIEGRVAGPPNPPGATPGTVSPQDRDAMIRMVAGEAGGEPPEGMAAVAHVALNRLSNNYGGAHTLSQVVNAPHQFEAMSRGRQPDPAAMQRAAQVVDGVLGGQIPDPTGGKINFLNPELQGQLGRRQPAWASGSNQRIGRHVFYGGGGAPPVSRAGQQASATVGTPAAPGFTPIVRTAAKAPKPQTPRTRPATPAEKARYGIAANVPAQVKADGTLDVINVPARAGGPSLRDQATLRKEFNALPDVKDYGDVATAYQQVKALATKAHPTAGDDIALTYSFMKMMDPGSVVREGEFAMVGKAAGLSDQVVMGLQKLDQGKTLTPAIRQKLVESARTIHQQRRQRYEEVTQQYQGVAREGGLPDNLIQMRRNPDAAPTRPVARPEQRARVTPAQSKTLQQFRGSQAPPGSQGSPWVPTTEQEFNGLPVGSFFINPADGKVMRKAR
jgi:hypothetical protein